MADVRRIVLAGRHHLHEARERLAPVLAQWAKQWCLGGADCQVRPAVAGLPRPPVGPARTRLARAEAGCLWVMAGDEAWREVVFGPAQTWLPEDATAQRLLDAALDALVTALAAPLGAMPCPGDGMPERNRSGEILHLEVAVNGSLVLVCLDVALVEALAPLPAAADKPVLAPRQSALGRAKVALTVEIPLLRAEMGEFLGLKVGDIVRGTPGLDARFIVRVDDQRLPLTAALGARDGCKAVRLEQI